MIFNTVLKFLKPKHKDETCVQIRTYEVQNISITELGLPKVLTREEVIHNLLEGRINLDSPKEIKLIRIFLRNKFM